MRRGDASQVTTGGALAVLVAVTNRALEVLADRPRAEDEQILVRRQSLRDLLDEPGQMLEAVRLAGGLRSPAAAVADPWVVPDVAGRPVMSRHLGVHPLDLSLVVLPANDDRLARIDPDESADRHVIASCHPPPRHACDHERDQAGRVSVSAARSA